MKQKISFVIVFLLMSLFFVSGCEKQEVQQIADFPTSHWNMIAGDDPQIMKELEYMRDQKIINLETYSKWLQLPKKEFMIGGSSYVDENGIIQEDELYILIPYDPIPAGMMTDPDFLSRRSIQEEMKKNSLKNR